MMDKIVNLFAVRNTGFMVVSRSAFATLLNMIQSYNGVSIYGYLLFGAQFGIGRTSTGQTLKRGELELSVENFMDFLDCGRSYAIASCASWPRTAMAGSGTIYQTAEARRQRRMVAVLG